MAHEDGGWRPKGATHEYGGLPVWTYDPGPHETSQGETDGDVDFSDLKEVETEGPKRSVASPPMAVARTRIRTPTTEDATPP
jgi:hypothetical protein